ncbi:MAG TPA: hypothetical protein VK638_27985 [Edaphobacter sp.]|nr:hypothetical protein [Edaphobacter sp.]
MERIHQLESAHRVETQQPETQQAELGKRSRVLNTMILVHHGHPALSSTISSVAGDDGRLGVNGTFMLPFVS